MLAHCWKRATFHVVKWATEALDEVRRGVWNTARAVAGTEPGRGRGRPRADAPRRGSDLARGLKNSRYALWKNPQNLTVRQAPSWSGSPRPTSGCIGRIGGPAHGVRLEG
jgi:transposase